MNWSLLIVLVAIVFIITIKREPFTELFGFSGHTKPQVQVRLDDNKPNLAEYTQVEVSLDHDIIQKLILKTSDEITKRTGICAYIIETTQLNKYVKDDVELYECVFMAVRSSGFTFGFSVSAYFEVQGGGEPRLVSLRTQPVGVDAPTDISPFIEGESGKEFIEYKLVKENAVPRLNELEMAKNNLM